MVVIKAPSLVLVLLFAVIPLITTLPRVLTSSPAPKLYEKVLELTVTPEGKAARELSRSAPLPKLFELESTFFRVIAPPEIIWIPSVVLLPLEIVEARETEPLPEDVSRLIL